MIGAILTLGLGGFSTVNYLPTLGYGAFGATTGAKLKYWTGITWVEKPLKRWSGASWDTETLKYWDGGAWE